MFDRGWRNFIALLGGAGAWPLAARAQQPKVPTIGALVIGNTDPEQFWRVFRQGCGIWDTSRGKTFDLSFDRGWAGVAGRWPGDRITRV
jgi:hypothetical protein